MTDIELTDLSDLANSNSVFTDTEWLKSIRENFGYNICVLSINEKDKSFIIPLFSRKKFSLKQIIMPLYLPYTAYVSPDSSLSKDGIDRLCLFLKKRFFSGKFAFIVSQSDKEWGTSKYTIERNTFLLDLESNTFDNYSKSKRKKCRKLIREYDIQTVKEKNLELFYKLEDKTFGRKNSSPLGNREQERGFIEDQLENGNMTQWVFYDGSNVTGTKIVINDYKQETVYAWKGYTDPEYLEKGFSILLTHLMIEESKKAFRFYNFHGANIESFASFKKGFGGVLKSYYEFNWTKLPELVAFVQRIKNDSNIFRL